MKPAFIIALLVLGVRTILPAQQNMLQGTLKTFENSYLYAEFLG